MCQHILCQSFHVIKHLIVLNFVFCGSICNWIEGSSAEVGKYNVDFWLSENGNVFMIQP